MAKAPESEIAAGETVLGQTSYGKSDVRLVKVRRGTDRHELTDVRVDVALEGDFEAAHTRGDNTGLLATDTMRNTVYALAKDHLTGEIEEFGKKLVEHFLETGPTVERVRVRFTEHLWDRIKVTAGSTSTPSSGQPGSAQRPSRVTGTASGSGPA
jgi:urate oxidase